MGASFWQIAIVVVVVAVLFGGKRLRNLGGDLGTSLKGFKKAMKDENASAIEHKESDLETTAEKTVEKSEDTTKS